MFFFKTGFIPAVGFQGSGTGCGINIGLCCDMNYSPSANIKNCGSFFVYLLLAPPPGSAYCAGRSHRLNFISHLFSCSSYFREQSYNFYFKKLSVHMFFIHF